MPLRSKLDSNVDFIPVRFVPDWFPGAGFKRLAKQIGKEVGAIERVPFDWAKEQIVSYALHELLTMNLLTIRTGQRQLCRILHVKTSPKRGPGTRNGRYITVVQFSSLCGRGRHGLCPMHALTF